MTTEKKKITINSVKDMLAALDSGDLSMIVAVLRAIALNPRKALSYGDDGCSLAAELEKRFLSAGGNVLKTGYFSALAAIDAPEFLAAYKKGFYMPECPEIMLASASKLSERPEEETRVFLSTALFNTAMPQQAQLAANIMTRFTELDTREAIRVALLANKEDVAVPALDIASLPAWISELCGPLQEEARRVLEQDAGEQGFRLFKAHWPDLPLQVRTWVLAWGARDYPVYALDLLADSLCSGERDLMLAALGGLESQPAFAQHLAGMVTGLVRSDDRSLRAAALRALAESDEKILADMLGDEELLLLAVKKLPATKEHGKLLFELLSSDSWAVRSVATSKILELGAPAADFGGALDYSLLGQGTKIALSRIFTSFDREDLVEALAKTGGIA